jgi:hypothetical protein
LVVFHRKLFGWKIKGLLDQINVSIHLPKWAKDVNKAAKIALLLTLTKVLTHKFLGEVLFKKNKTFEHQKPTFKNQIWKHSSGLKN